MQIPGYVSYALNKLKEAEFEAFLVGGCARDLLLGIEPTDYDITTNASPDEIMALFEHSFYTNTFGTVTVVIESNNIEITTFRADGRYVDGRHPLEVQFGVSLKEDLARRDFTINALCLTDVNKEKGTYNVIDYFGGQEDLKNKLIRAVNDPNDRFSEDALRMLRAIRFATNLGFEIEERTRLAIMRNAHLIGLVSAERIRDEINKMMKGSNPAKGIQLLDNYNLLIYIVPELLVCKGVTQKGHHIHDVYTHLLLTLKHCPSKKVNVRIAALLHDIGKPQTKEMGEDGVATFYGHEFVGEKIVRTILERLKFPVQDIKEICHLVRNHMFFYDQNVTDAAVRRILKKIGPENLEDFIDLRVGDRIGSGAEPKSWRLLEFEKRAYEVRHHPINTKDLAIDGNKIIEILNTKPGPLVGEIQKHLLDLVIEDPERNIEEFLIDEVKRYSENPTKVRTPRDELEAIQKKILIKDF